MGTEARQVGIEDKIETRAGGTVVASSDIELSDEVLSVWADLLLGLDDNSCPEF